MVYQEGGEMVHLPTQKQEAAMSSNVISFQTEKLRRQERILNRIIFRVEHTRGHMEFETGYTNAEVSLVKALRKRVKLHIVRDNVESEKI